MFCEFPMQMASRFSRLVSILNFMLQLCCIALRVSGSCEAKAKDTKYEYQRLI